MAPPFVLDLIHLLDDATKVIVDMLLDDFKGLDVLFIDFGKNWVVTLADVVNIDLGFLHHLLDALHPYLSDLTRSSL
jgi:hypothetical protein